MGETIFVDVSGGTVRVRKGGVDYLGENTSNVDSLTVNGADGGDSTTLFDSFGAIPVTVNGDAGEDIVFETDSLAPGFGV